MSDFAIINSRILNEGIIREGTVLIRGEFISNILEPGAPIPGDVEILDARGKLLIPGVIDCHVHFREPGLTHKADLESESRAAVAGGVTSFFEMPNTQPSATTLELLEEKYRLAGEKSHANFSFFLGASNDNIGEIRKLDPSRVCGVKVFFGASTGNMLVDKLATLEDIFHYSPVPVAAHCEDETIIRTNSQLMKERFGDKVPVEMHPVIRNEEACYRSSELAVNLAMKYNTRLHITHLSTVRELMLLDNHLPLGKKRITSEACIHYLWLCDSDYSRLGMRMKVNPAIKTERDRMGLLEGLKNGKLDIISTDHAPHLLSEKSNDYFKSPSGTPLVQYLLPATLELVLEGKLTLEMAVDKLCHAPAVCYGIEKRGYIRPGYFADLVLVDMNHPFTVSKDTILSKCGWSVFEGFTFHSSITHTFVNGILAYESGVVRDSSRGKRITFNR